MWCIWKTFLYIPLGWASWMCGHVFLGGGPGTVLPPSLVLCTWRHTAPHAPCRRFQAARGCDAVVPA
jgi:hypothetical protein